MSDIPCWIDIRRNADGVVRRYYEPDLVWHAGDSHPEFIWEEGNFACDCNRDLFFGRSVDPDYDRDDDESARCGRERYSIRIVDGRDHILYDEWKE